MEIDNILRERGVVNYRETYSKDTILANPKDDECLVINLEDYFDGNGTRWVAIYNKERDVE